MQFNDSDGEINETADELTNNATELSQKALSFAGKPIKAGAEKLGKKAVEKTGQAAKKGAQKAAKKAAKKAQKAAKAAIKAAKAAAAAIKAAIAAIGWPLLILIIIVAVIGTIIAIFNFLENNKKAKSTDYETIAGINLDASWDEKLKDSFYAMYSNYSYYYTVDNSSVLCQGNASMSDAGDINAKRCEDNVSDKGGREASFALSTEFLKYLDESLNGNKRYPRQFIKPVYNTCSTGEEKNGMCAKKDLIDGDFNGGEGLPLSQAFNIATCKKGEDCSGKYQLDKSDTMHGVWDWGFAPILHYVKHEDEDYVTNFRVKEITYWDKEKEKYVTCQKSKCPDEYVEKVEAQEKSKIKADKLYRHAETVYLIDNVATFMGNASNEIEEKEEKVGEHTENGVLKDKEAEPKLYKRYSTLKNVTLSKKDTKYYDDDEIIKSIRIVKTTTELVETEIDYGSVLTPNPGYNNAFTNKGTFNQPSTSTKKDNNTKTIPKYSTETNSSIVHNEACRGKLTVKNNAFYCNGAKLTKKAADSGNDRYQYEVWKQEEKPIRYIMKGDKYKKEFKYKNEEPDVSEIDEGQYLTDYINNYQAYAKKDEIEGYDKLDSIRKIFAKKEKTTYEEQTFSLSHVLDLLYTLYGQDVFEEKQADCVGKKCVKSKKSSNNMENGFTSEKGIDRTGDTINNMNATYKNISPELKEQFKTCAEKYGIDINLLKAMAMQESAFGTSPDTYTGSGHGIMQIENVHLNTNMTAVTTTGERVSIYVTEAARDDPLTNIELGAIEFRNKLDNWKANIPLSLQAYNFGDGGLNIVLKAYMKENTDQTKDSIIANSSNLGWTALKYMSQYKNSKGKQLGDAEYISHVLQYVSKSQVTVAGPYYEGTVVFDIDKLTMTTGGSIGENLSLDEKLNWAANKSIIYSNWHYFYDSTREALKIDIDKTKNKYMSTDDSDAVYYRIGFKPKRSKASVQKVIATYFAQTTKTQISDNMNITKEMWREKFTEMFGAQGASKMKLTKYIWSDYFSSRPSTPLRDNFKAVRSFGWEEDSIYTNQNGYLAHGGKFARYMVMKGKVNEEVYPIADGEVIDVGKDYITIQHEPGDKEQNIETTIEGINPSSEYGVGELVSLGDVIGTIKTEEINVYLVVGNVYTDPEWILEEAKKDQSMGLTGSLLADSIGVTNAESAKIIEYIKKNADKLQKEFEKDAEKNKFFNVGGVNVEDSWSSGSALSINSVAWTRQIQNCWSCNHEGVDVGTTGTVAAFQKGILVSYVDGFPNTGQAGGGCAYNSFNNNLANTAIVLYMDNNKTWYSVIYGHLLTGSTTPLKRKVSDPVMKKYEQIAITGNSGCSSGSHTHVQIHQLNGKKLSEIADFYSKNRGSWSEKTWGLGDPYLPGNHCENNHSRQCFYNPASFFNVRINDKFTGRAQLTTK